ncbi:MAG: YceI family protein [Polyangiaceae bacterium]|nr:YceI family protein [Polyangiaceae bacterium]
MHRFLRPILSAAAALSVSWAASAALEDAGDVDVRFLATGPAGMKINGTAPSLSAKESDGKVTIKVPVTNLQTGMKLRDKHLRQYLETDKHPSATLVVDRSSLKFPENDQTARGTATGSFTLHGVTKSLEFQYKALRTGSDYHVQALATVDIRDHQVEVPCYLGVCVDPKVKLKVKLKLRDK